MWELDISRDDGKTYETVARKPSAEACKTYARSLHRTPNGINPGIIYRLYARDGYMLQYLSYDNQSWRMIWGPGNLQPRESQQGQHINPASEGAAQ